MKKEIIGKKLGMTQVFASNGIIVPVTVIEAGPCSVLQKKTMDKDGYEAVKVAFSDERENLLNKPEAGEFKKANVKAKKYVQEIKPDNINELEVGSEIKCDVFKVGDYVDVTGTTRGRGYTGVIQRWNAQRHRMTHGVSLVHRASGSAGSNTLPARVFKGKKLAGQYGNETVTVQNLKVVKVDTERNLLLISGAVPGNKNSLVTIKSAVK